MPILINDSPKVVPNLKPFNRVVPQKRSFDSFSNVHPLIKPLGYFNNRINRTHQQQKQPLIPVPGEGLPRVIHYCADQSGCAFWRLIWPAEELLAHNKAVVMTLYQMVTIGQFYGGIDAVRLQRQCSDHQVEFIKFLRKVSDEMKKQTGKGFRIIWEVDDLVLPACDIPDYNVCKSPFEGEQIHKNVLEVTKYIDEITVPSNHMKEHYKYHLNFDKISVIPNYAPKNWIDRGYDKERVMERYNKHSKKPRVLYAGSGTHFDVQNKTNQKDDFAGVVEAIIKDILIDKKYEWVFLGAIPLKLRQFIGKGVEFHPWCAITDYTEKLKELKVNVSIAPLENNSFNRSKANIKLTEAGMQGIPCVAQNIDCYNFDGWKYLFNTADEMFSIIDKITSSERAYEEAVDFVRDYSEKYLIQDHLDQYVNLYTTEYGDLKRKDSLSFVNNNKQQFT